MFEIRFKVFEDKGLESHELKGANGYFEFQVENETYGIYIPENIDVFSVSIYWWFYYFLKAILMLNETNYVLISDIEKSDVWIEIKKIDWELIISKVRADKPVGSTALESRIMPNLKYEYWKDKKVNWTEFLNEILSKAKEYLCLVQSLNDKSHTDLIALNVLIKQVEDSF
ncbi:hypothetical protein FACS189418_1330 [Clostridia bacterium]|nr:hypothetical protein FACS189418_1330 [Clostridia bacterium]